MSECATAGATVGPPLLYSVPGAAEQLSVGRTTVYRLIRTGRLRTVRIGDRSLITREELERFVDELVGAPS